MKMYLFLCNSYYLNPRNTLHLASVLKLIRLKNNVIILCSYNNGIINNYEIKSVISIEKTFC